MFKGIHYRSAYSTDLKNPNGLKRFAERCLSALIDNVKKKSTSMRQRIQEMQRDLDATKSYLDKVDAADLLSDNEFFSARRKIRISTFLVMGILITEGLLNYFSTLVFISGEDLGLSLLRWLIGIVLTLGAIASAERFMEAIMPVRKHSDPESKPRSILMVVLWTVLFVGVEIAIAGVSETRARDIEGGHTGGLLYFGFIILSMVLPLIAGGLSWDFLHVYDSYKYTRKHNVAKRTWDTVDRQIKIVMQRLEDYYNVRLNEAWNRFNDFRSYKEYYNLRRGMSENVAGQFYDEFNNFKSEADRRYGAILGQLELPAKTASA
ncbi:MAG TPA: hypothetical protein VLX91_00800 [Candidatus Acidoferrales bacterium]|nr:hypothetical protein [Candidatus Acidoferrales bacterium]